MELTIPKIVKPLALKDYDEQFGDQTLSVWVNPPIAVLEDLSRALLSINEVKWPEAGEENQLDEGQSDAINAKVDAILTEQLRIYTLLLNQGPTNRFSEEELRKLVDETGKTDPMLWMWIRGKIGSMIHKHRTIAKKV